MTAPVGLIWAEARGGVIGADGGMPWHVPEDLAHFKAKTLGAPVVMGRRTWESFPARFRPLPGRRNIVVTRNSAWTDAGAERAASLEDALALAGADDPDRVWVIGGGSLYREAITFADRLEITELDLDVAGDTLAPDRAGWHAVAVDPPEGWHTSRTGIRFRMVTAERGA
ncbi:dihydrofolate reductase [Microbacterium terrae]|uniref:Dihydrofolate reductase n=1 Tax=Microbacterium terrae TaxID=69369 RepID=A0A0M2GZ11_9MICO|nr:dihydrofolate reductase [Microbacterium terrae]KJL39103.1 Dihydrofolate reductase [Microbacterium terrae]MBP1077742.1 dihydrofolate reductase [Microbacterium terrae]GLJ99910.1 dihydrofolate reductase [Microbacterium terrae]